MGIRYYQPELARFTQPDPAVPASKLAGGNLYAYAACNPTNNTDPTGAISECALSLISFGIGVGGSYLAIAGIILATGPVGLTVAIISYLVTAAGALISLYALRYGCPA